MLGPSVCSFIEHSSGDECFAVALSVEDESRKCPTVDQHAAPATATAATGTLKNHAVLA